MGAQALPPPSLSSSSSLRLREFRVDLGGGLNQTKVLEGGGILLEQSKKGFAFHQPEQILIAIWGKLLLF